MLSIMRRILVLTLVFRVTLAGAAPLPDFQASYELSRGSLKIGTSTIELVTGDNDSYTYRSHSAPVRWVGWLLKDKLYETSKGRFDASGIRPESYHYQRTGGSREREARLAFDWQAGSVENEVEDSRWKMDIPPGTLDKLVSQLGMMQALARGETDINFNIADGGKLKTYRFRVIGTETVQTPAGSFEAVKITRVRDNNKRETYIWCAPGLHYLPVRIWQREKDDSEYQSDLESFSSSLETASDIL